jgi:ISXO2-like transposase domain
VTDGHAGHNKRSLGRRSHDKKVQTKAERRKSDALQGCHWTTSLLKRWLLGTHAGAVPPKHLQAYLDEFAFRHNRRKTNGVGRIAARVIEQLVARGPLHLY